ncbi:hypothetical protein ACFL0M_02255 [Thermodesulfobacteriota bacterium]
MVLERKMGGLVTTFQIIGTLANFPSGAAVDMLGRRNIFMGISLITIGISYIMVAAAKSYIILIVVTIITAELLIIIVPERTSAN